MNVRGAIYALVRQMWDCRQAEIPPLLCPAGQLEIEARRVAAETGLVLLAYSGTGAPSIIELDLRVAAGGMSSTEAYAIIRRYPLVRELHFLEEAAPGESTASALYVDGYYLPYRREHCATANADRNGDRAPAVVAPEDAHSGVNANAGGTSPGGPETSEIEIVAAMARRLKQCLTPEQVYAATASAMSELFPSVRGIIYAVDNRESALVPAKSWGPELAGDQGSITMESGPPDISSETRVERRAHPSAGIRIPIESPGETLGALEVNRIPADYPVEKLSMLAQVVADQAALALDSLRLQDRLRAQTFEDPLTGVFNRRYMEVSLERELRRARRSERPVSLVMLDVDQLKRVNDTLGHSAGDLLVKDLADHLRCHIRNSDALCRYGGDEFLMVLPEASLEQAYARAEALLVSIPQALAPQQPMEPVTVSMGVAAYPDSGATMEQVLQAADQALFRAKRAGRNQISRG